MDSSKLYTAKPETLLRRQFVGKQHRGLAGCELRCELGRAGGLAGGELDAYLESTGC